MSEKLCVFCKRFDWESIYTDAPYSEYTGGDTWGGASCGAGHYRDERPSDTEDFRVLILRAEKCKDYEPPK